MTYPEHEKIHAVKEQSQAQGDFLLWIEQQGFYLMQWSKEIEEDVPVTESTEQLLARFHGIDLKALAAEKDAMLEAYQKPCA